jgi:hypothetical protein
MERLLAVLLSCVLLVGSTGCGKIFVRGVLGGSGVVQTATGFVSIVQFTNVAGSGTLIDVTLVTFLQNGSSTTVTFCGDQRSQFPMNQFVTANFTPGQPCAEVLTIVVQFH